MYIRIPLAIAMVPALIGFNGYASTTTPTDTIVSVGSSSCCHAPTPLPKPTERLTIGGYGEAVYSHHFFSDKYMRYTDAARYRDSGGHGRFDLPHVVLFLGYDFGQGWSMGTEVEIEHGGVGSAVEIETEEAGEYESEVERGGEVVLEQFWIQKSFGPRLNLRAGHIIVPVGATNSYHMPTEFFTAYRPEGENTILPCTWHETGISLWGRLRDWRYELLLIGGLDADRFGSQHWIRSSAGSPYEFKIANRLATAFRIDNYSLPHLRISLSGYYGDSFKNTLAPTESERYRGLRGTVMIGALDAAYTSQHLIVRGHAVYGHLSDSELISIFNMNSMRKNSPSPKQPIGSDAYALGIEAGYDLLSLCGGCGGRKLFLFGRYDAYDAMYKTQGSVHRKEWAGRQRIAAGLNYFPIKDIVLKGEYSIGLLRSQYNPEPTISFSIAYSGLFRR